MPNCNFIEFLFSIEGVLIPRNYHYCLYSALTSLSPKLKDNPEWAISRISNTNIFDDRTLRLTQSTIKLRCSKDLITELTMLFDCQIHLGKELIKLKLVNGTELKSQENLAAWVSIKTDNNREPDLTRFAVSLGKQLAKFDINTLPTIGRKEQLIIKKQPCAVYPVMFSDLRSNESLILQEKGLGGRKHLGCGFFE
jgi:CRISPR-associated protein Cas6